MGWDTIGYIAPGKERNDDADGQTAVLEMVLIH